MNEAWLQKPLWQPYPFPPYRAVGHLKTLFGRRLGQRWGGSSIDGSILRESSCFAVLHLQHMDCRSHHLCCTHHAALRAWIAGIWLIYEIIAGRGASARVT